MLLRLIFVIIFLFISSVSSVDAKKLYDMGDPDDGGDTINDWLHLYDMSVGPTGTSVKININDIFTAYLLGQTITTQYALVVFDGSGALSETGVLIDSSDNVSGAASYSTTKVSGVKGIISAYEANSTDTNYTGFGGALSIPDNMVYDFPNADPTLGQFWTFGATSGGVSQIAFASFDEATIELSAGIVQVKDGGVGVEKLTSITLSPIILAEPDELQPIADAWPLFQFLAETYPSGVVITSIHISTSATCTDVLNFEEWSNNGTSWSVDSTVENITLSGTHTEDDGALADPDIAADGWLYADLPASPANIAYYSIVISFTAN